MGKAKESKRKGRKETSKNRKPQIKVKGRPVSSRLLEQMTRAQERLGQPPRPDGHLIGMHPAHRGQVLRVRRVRGVIPGAGRPQNY